MSSPAEHGDLNGAQAGADDLNGADTSSDGLTYRAAGVDVEAGEQAVRLIKKDVESTYIPGVVGSLGGFAGLFELPKDLKDPVLVTGTDGVGTKLLLAQETGRLDTVGIDLVAMSVNDVLTIGARPILFLDYVAVGRLVPAEMAQMVAGVAEGCRQAGCALVGGEMAEMPGLYDPGEFDMAGFCVGLGERHKLVDGSMIEEGDVVLGLASSGVHSNGFSLVRKVLEASKLPLGRDLPALLRDHRANAAQTHPHLRAERAGAAGAGRPGQRHGPHHRRRHGRQPVPGHPRRALGSAQPEAIGRSLQYSGLSSDWATSPTTRCS